MGTVHSFANGRDLVMDCINQHYERAQKSRQPVQIMMDTFTNVMLVECTTRDKYGATMHRDWFKDGVPTFSYWLSRDERSPIVRKFFEAGYTITRISQMLGFSVSTIAKDVKEMRVNGELPAEGNFRLKPEVINNKYRVRDPETRQQVRDHLKQVAAQLAQ